MPIIFQRVRRQPLLFFVKRVLGGKHNIRDIVCLREQLMLKGFVKELGKSINSQPALRALQMASIVREGSTMVLSSQDDANSGLAQASSWVSSHFMYILVNVVQFRWQQKKSYEKVEDLRSLHLMLDFLRAAESAQYLPQIMATVSAAAAQRLDADTCVERRTLAELRYLAVGCMLKFIRLVAAVSLETLGESLASLVVSLIPILRDDTEVEDRGRCVRKAEVAIDPVLTRIGGETRSIAVSIMRFLVEGDAGRMLADYFRNVAFLFQMPVLRHVRGSLESYGVDFDCLQDSESMEADSVSKSTQSEGSIGGDSRTRLALSKQMVLRQRIDTISGLLAHEDQSVRQEVLKHLAKLLRENRKTFHTLIENESSTSAGSFLTESDEDQNATKGTVTSLIQRLLARSVRESEDIPRRLVASCLGEVGAVGEHMLNGTIMLGQEDYSGEESHKWRLKRPPWKTKPEDYELQLVTKNLVWALRAATSSADQHKVGYSIQQLLVLIQRGRVDNTTTKQHNTTTKEHQKGPMAKWLVEILSEVGVRQDVEPFWSTDFHETEVTNKKKPPFLENSSTYLSWISNWCRYMTFRSQSRQSSWSHLFNACRTALRSAAGLTVAEFLLPLLVLDRLCFGDAAEEKDIVQEMEGALKLKKTKLLMQRGEGQKIVNAVFTIIDTFQYWLERDIEDRYKRRSSERKVSDDGVESWPQDESAMRIEDLLVQIPLELQATAAERVGMNSRSLRLLEMASRAKVSEGLFGGTLSAAQSDRPRSGASMPAGTCTVECVQLMKGVLSSLDDYETLTSLAKGENSTQQPTSSKILDNIREQLAAGDFEDALQGYERGLQLRNDSVPRQVFHQGILRCLLELGQHQSVLNQVRGIISASSEKPGGNKLLPYAIQAAWRLGDWTTLSKVASEAEGSDVSDLDGRYNILLGQAILSIQKKDSTAAFRQIADCRSTVMERLAITGRDSYARSYEQIVRLRSLQELEDFARLGDRGIPSITTDVLDDWNRRLEIIAPESAVSLMNIRLAIARLANNRALEGKLFLNVGRRARKNGKFHIATTYFTKADDALDLQSCAMSDFSQLQLERAKLKYHVGESSAALRLLDLGNFEAMARMESRESQVEATRRVAAIVGIEANQMDERDAADVFVHAALKSIKWMVDDGLKAGQEILSGFRVIQRIAPKWEKGHFRYAKYVESVMKSRIALLQRRSSTHSSSGNDGGLTANQALALDRASQKYLILAVQHYAEALTLDLKHLYQALPRLLSLWFQFTSINEKVTQAQKIALTQSQRGNVNQASPSVLSSNQDQLNELIAKSAKGIAPQAFYSAIAQLISRITHAHKDTKSIVEKILARILQKFPEQAMWQFAWLVHAKDTVRRNIGLDLFSKVQESLRKGGNKNMGDLLLSSRSLFKYLHDSELRLLSKSSFRGFCIK
uniref:non-specific serine/threonine protein kinase n=1 Tax=Entomoneis paludosa TaxID=265537 RepID=A0A6U2XGY7_9STRA